MHWIYPLFQFLPCWVFVEVFKWPQQWLNMLSIPNISQRQMLNHGWESLDTLGTARAWAQPVERCCANAHDFVEPHMDDREAKDTQGKRSQNKNKRKYYSRRPNLTKQNSMEPMLSKVDSRLIGTPGSDSFSRTYSLAGKKQRRTKKKKGTLTQTHMVPIKLS